MNESRFRCSTSVGTRIEGSTSRTSNSPISLRIRLIVAGLAASRSRRPAHSTNAGSPASAGSDARWPRGPRPSARPAGPSPHRAPRRSRPTRIRRPGGPREGGVQHERAHALGVGGREHRRHRAALERAHDRDPLRAGGVHHGDHVVHLLLERRRAPERVGQPGAAPVERDQAGEAREPAHHALERGLGPEVLDLGDPRRDPQQVDARPRPRRCRRCAGRRSSRSGPPVPWE